MKRSQSTAERFCRQLADGVDEEAMSHEGGGIEVERCTLAWHMKIKKCSGDGLVIGGPIVKARADTEVHMCVQSRSVPMMVRRRHSRNVTSRLTRNC